MNKNNGEMSAGVTAGCLLAFVLNGTIFTWFILIPIFGVHYYPDVVTKFWKVVRGSGGAASGIPASWQFSLSIVLTIALLSLIYWIVRRPLLFFILKGQAASLAKAPAEKSVVLKEKGRS